MDNDVKSQKMIDKKDKDEVDNTEENQDFKRNSKALVAHHFKNH